jgi:dynein heavy chain
MLVTGMFMEGCRWNNEKFILDESEPKILYTKCPMFWFKPIKTDDIPVT